MARRTKEEQLDTRKRILEEGERLFAEKGFDNTGIDEIARCVGITKSVIYYHFKNKDAILQTLIGDYLAEALAVKKRSGGEFFREAGRNFKELLRIGLRQAESRRALARIIMMESIKEGEALPLFDLWEENALFVADNWGDRMKEGVMDEPLKIMLETFFMFMMPMVGYQIFSERLSEKYGFSAGEVEDSFVETFTQYFEKILQPKIWNLKE